MKPGPPRVRNSRLSGRFARSEPGSTGYLDTCLDDLGLVEQQDDGSQVLIFRRLTDIADTELRHATLGAAWMEGSAENGCSEDDDLLPF